MAADQTPTRRPKFVSQRDGSALANSNCRMASICMGLDHHTRGMKTSTGGKMRSYTDDQSGGTDSGDARESWKRGYGQSLIVNDGDLFDRALVALRAGKVVHLDVWHATLGGCVSGTGAYGHTIAVLPDCADGKWLVGDPWCLPGTGYRRISESTLRSASEAWGRKVIQSTGGPVLRLDPKWRLLIAVVAKRLMSEHFPGDDDPDEPPADTGGPQPILFTTTNVQPLKGTADMDDLFNAGKMQRQLPSGTDLFDEPNGTKTGDLPAASAANVVFTIVAQTADENWWLVDGGGEGKKMSWVKAL